MAAKLSQFERGLLDHMKELLEDRTHSDVVLRCGRAEFYAHKAILSARSPVLRKAFSPGSWRESKEGVFVFGDPFDLDEIDASNDPVAIQMMLHFIYSGDYLPSLDPYGLVAARMTKQEDDQTFEQLAIADTNETEDAAEQNDEKASPADQSNERPGMDGGVLKLHVRLHALGDKYEMPQLMTLAAQKFLDDGNELPWNDAAFCEAATIAFTTGPDHNIELSDVIVRICHEHIQATEPSDEIKECIKALPKLAYGLYDLGRRILQDLDDETDEEAQNRESSPWSNFGGSRALYSSRKGGKKMKKKSRNLIGTSHDTSITLSGIRTGQTSDHNIW